MNSEGFGEQGEGAGYACWTSAMSSFMLKHLANVVASGTRTSSGFKKTHLNACARAVNEKFNTTRTGDQIKNHYKTWQKKYVKLNRLKQLSGAGWDENNYIITLDSKQYNDHIAAHKGDAEYLNKPLENWAEMAIIFGNSMATGKFAKDSSSALGTEEPNNEDVDVDVHVPDTPEDNGAASSASRPNKRARIDDNEDTSLVKALKYGSDRLAAAIEKGAAGNMDLPPDLIEKVQDLPGFDDTHKSYYYAHLVENPHVGRVFYSAPFEYKLNFMAKWISEKFP